MRFEPRERSFLVDAHQSRIADNVSGKDCRQFAFDLWLASRIRHLECPSTVRRQSLTQTVAIES
jgi:hypothetical protein